MDEKVQKYLLHLMHTEDGRIKSLQEQALKDNIPIMEDLSMQFLQQIVKILQPRKILEIGTAIGYSAIQMHNAHPHSVIYTIERDETMYKEAVRQINKWGKEDKIKVISGDALEKLQLLRTKELTFDLIFIDAAKSQYKNFFMKANPLLRKQGIIITDNVLFRGKVIQTKNQTNRLQRLAHKIHLYNEWLMAQTNYMTTIVPIGDGLALSYKLENGDLF